MTSLGLSTLTDIELRVRYCWTKLKYRSTSDPAHFAKAKTVQLDYMEPRYFNSWGMFHAEIGDPPALKGWTPHMKDPARGWTPGNMEWRKVDHIRPKREKLPFGDQTVTIGLETLTISEWAHRHRISINTVRTRYNTGVRGEALFDTRHRSSASGVFVVMKKR